MGIVRSLLLFSVLPCFLLLTLLEGAARIFEPERIRAESEPEYEGSATQGLRYKMGYPTTNGDTFNNIRPFSEHSPNERIAIIGDSYIQGLGAATESIPYLIERYVSSKHSSTVEVMNFGLSSTGAVHYFLRYKEIVRKYDNSIIVIAIHDNDVLDSSEFNPTVSTKPIYRIDNNGKIVNIAFSSNENFNIFRDLARKIALYRIVRFGMLASVGDMAEETFSPFMEALANQNESELAMNAQQRFFYWLESLVKLIKDDKRKPFVVYFPGNMVVNLSLQDKYISMANARGMMLDFEHLDHLLEDFCKSRAVEYKSLLQPLRMQANSKSLYLSSTEPGGKGFGHFTYAGNELASSIVGEALLNLLQK